MTTDDLRTRIAAVIDREVDGYWEPFAVADAVIAELGLRREWLTRHESGGGRIHNTREDAYHRLSTFVIRPPGVEDPGSGELIGVESRYVTEWEPE